jgi:hypothetical protein
MFPINKLSTTNPSYSHANPSFVIFLNRIIFILLILVALLLWLPKYFNFVCCYSSCYLINFDAILLELFYYCAVGWEESSDLRPIVSLNRSLYIVCEFKTSTTLFRISSNLFAAKFSVNNSNIFKLDSFYYSHDSSERKIKCIFLIMVNNHHSVHYISVKTFTS